ncbi:MAG: ATPase P [Deltaproteobacteria bacterium]|nr:ATPase P [Deltaproteobacteria bacterium]
MLNIDIPGRENPLNLNHLVLDYNGTIALDGTPLPGFGSRTAALGQTMSIHVLTADTHGTATAMLRMFGIQACVIGSYRQDEQKLEFIRKLGPENCACIGNGRNDLLMLEAAALGIAVIQSEGAYASLVAAADIVCTSVLDALDLFLHPLRLVATLRL